MRTAEFVAELIRARDERLAQKFEKARERGLPLEIKYVEPGIELGFEIGWTTTSMANWEAELWGWGYEVVYQQTFNCSFGHKRYVKVRLFDGLLWYKVRGVTGERIDSKDIIYIAYEDY